MTEIIVCCKGTEIERRPIDRALFTIGRSPKSDLPIDSAVLSLSHARLERREQGWMLRDLGSIKGVLVNGKAVTDPVFVDVNSLIQVGAYLLRLVEDGRKEPLAVKDSSEMVYVAMVSASSVEPTSYALLGESLVLGRSSDADITLPSRKISRTHAILRRDGSAYQLENQSQNGTRVNQRKIAYPTRIDEGDVIHIGPYRLDISKQEVQIPHLDEGDPSIEEGTGEAFSPQPTMLLGSKDITSVKGVQDLEKAREKWRQERASRVSDPYPDPIEDAEDFAELPMNGEVFDDDENTAAALDPETRAAAMVPRVIVKLGRQLLYDAPLTSPTLSIGDSARCDVVLRAGDCPLGTLALLVRSGEALVVVPLHPALDLSNGAVHDVIARGENIAVGPLRVIWQ